jgi:2,5-diketo-D-gluconate reductase A|tara:strand:+ start:294 stop:1196 length:903 start_codon:yes stop_codon:yes gene_type:complete
MTNRKNRYVPSIGLGTYNMAPEEAEKMTYESIMHGYRHIDTAAVYKNEEAVGVGLKRAITELNLNREDIFVTTKLWPGGLIKDDRIRNYEGSIKSFEKSLLKLGLDYIDLYLIHSPHARNKRIEQWQALIDIKEQEKVKHIGVSNWGINHLEEISQENLPLPDANQIELHPWSQKPELVNYLREKDIDIIAYSSLVPLSTWRHKDGENSKKTEEMQQISNAEDSPFKLLANKYNVSEAQLLLKWALELGYSILPKSIESKRMKENFDLDFSISQNDMDYINTLDQGGSVTWEYGDPLQVL